MYNPELEKKEYEAARCELLEEVARGTSIQEIRARLMKKNDGDDTKEPSHTDSKTIPEDLVQIQACIRWEKAGKPNYSPDQQLREFEEARNELQMELDKGASLDEIRRKITKGEIKTKVTKHLLGKKYFSIERIQRQKRDLMHILNKYEAKPVDQKVLSKPRDLTTVELLAKEKDEQDENPVLNKSGWSIVDIKIEDESFKGMSFVLASGLRIEDQISMLTFPQPMPPSNSRSFNIAADLTNEAKDAGELGLVGILVWMRFMATRQLIWNKNYNVKPRIMNPITQLLQRSHL